MPEPTAPAPAAAAAPAVQTDSPQSAPAPDPELSRLQRELAELKSREGRFRNEKGVMQARIRELEQLALSNGTGEPEYGQPSATPAYPGPATAYGQPVYQPPAAASNFVSREEFDLWRVEREFNNADRFNQVRQIALDGNRVGDFIAWDVDPSTGQPFRSVYKTYKRIAEHLELEDLRKAQAASNPNRNPALGAISGTSAASSPEQLDVSELTPEQVREKFPEAFAPHANPWAQ